MPDNFTWSWFGVETPDEAENVPRAQALLFQRRGPDADIFDATLSAEMNRHRISYVASEENVISCDREMLVRFTAK